jgi:hypothetical protein
MKIAYFNCNHAENLFAGWYILCFSKLRPVSGNRIYGPENWQRVRRTIMEKIWKRWMLKAICCYSATSNKEPQLAPFKICWQIIILGRKGRKLRTLHVNAYKCFWAHLRRAKCLSRRKHLREERCRANETCDLCAMHVVSLLSILLPDLLQVPKCRLTCSSSKSLYTNEGSYSETKCFWWLCIILRITELLKSVRRQEF